MATKKKASKVGTDLTVQILVGIRSDLQGIREELVRTASAIRDEVAQVSARLERLERRQAEADVRVATELTSVAHALGALQSALVSEVREVKSIALEIRDERARMDALEARIQRLEAKAS